jgi:hypothetical protein
MHTAAAVAMRALALHCVAAVAFGVDRGTVVSWMRDERIWDAASPAERAFLEHEYATEDVNRPFQWRKEAEWTLLWAAGLVGALGPPSRQCDTVVLAVDIMPRLGSDIAPFLERAVLRPDPEVRAENARHENLWRQAVAARRSGAPPPDVTWSVLDQRRYAFTWLGGTVEWDRVRCDA